MKCFKDKQIVKLCRADGSIFNFQDYVNCCFKHYNVNIDTSDVSKNWNDIEYKIKADLNKIIDRLYLSRVKNIK